MADSLDLDARPAKFRKKPIVIEAMRIRAYTELLGPAPWNDNAGGDVWAWVERNGGRISCQQDEPGPAYAMVTTLEGVMRGDIGDWIIKGVAGEFYPCKPDIFDATYERAARAAVDTRSEPAQWYLVQHFAPTDRREANPLRSFIVQGDSHGDALEKVPEHPREWASKVMPVEMLAARASVTPTDTQELLAAIQNALNEEAAMYDPPAALYQPSPGQLFDHVHHRIAHIAARAVLTAPLDPPAKEN